MSFFKKLSAELESFIGDKDKDKSNKEGKHGHSEEANRGGDPNGYSPHSVDPHSTSYSVPFAHPSFGPPPPHPGYGAPPPASGYGPVSHQPQYSQSSYYGQGQRDLSYPQDGSNAQTYYAPPSYPPPVPGPSQCPPGWVARFDENYKTWYYVNEPTRVSQWNHPSSTQSHSFSLAERDVDSHGTSHGYYGAPSHSGHESHGYDSHSGAHGYDSHNGALSYDSHGGNGHHDEPKKDKKKKKKDEDNSKMLAAGAAGLVVGGVAGAVIAHEMMEGDSGSEEQAEPEPEPEEGSSSLGEGEDDD